MIQACEGGDIQIHDNNCSNVSAVRALQVVYVLSIQFENNRCSEDALPFFCTAINSLCAENISLPSLSEECLDVRDNKCSSEWRTAESLFKVSVPSCLSFRNGTNLTFSSAPIQTCPDISEVFCGSLCLPSCHEITLLRDGVYTAFRVWFTVFYFVSLIGGVIAIIASIVYREKMYVSTITYYFTYSIVGKFGWFMKLKSSKLVITITNILVHLAIHLPNSKIFTHSFSPYIITTKFSL